MPDEGSGAGGGEEVEALLRRLEPQMIALFRRHAIDPPTAAVILEEVVTLLLYRWGQVSRPEVWLMELLEVQVVKRQAARKGKGET